MVVEGGDMVNVDVTVTMPPAFLCQAILQEHIENGAENAEELTGFLDTIADNGTLNCDVSIVAVIDPDDDDFTCLGGDRVPQLVIFSHVDVPSKITELCVVLVR